MSTLFPGQNLNIREGQKDNTPINQFAWTKKGVRLYHKFKLQK